MKDLSIPPWVERKRWLVDASWFTVWDATPDLAQATWEWPTERMNASERVAKVWLETPASTRDIATRWLSRT